MKNMGLCLYISNNQKISTTIEVKKISGVSPSYFRTPSLSFQKVSFLLIHYFMSEDNKKTLLSINIEWIGFEIVSNFITVSVKADAKSTTSYFLGPTFLGIIM